MYGLNITPIDRPRRGRRLAIAISLGAAALVAGSGPVLGHEAHGHPARIHEGTCEDLGGVAFRLTGVGASVDLDGAPMATPTAVNPDLSFEVLVSDTTIDGSLEDVLAADHAVMVYESDEEMTAISCGNVAGVRSGETLITGLGEAGVPGHLGFALFQPEGDQTVVTVIVGHAMAPISASGAGDDHDDEEGDHDADEHDEGGEEDEHDAAATPVP